MTGSIGRRIAALGAMLGVNLGQPVAPKVLSHGGRMSTLRMLNTSRSKMRVWVPSAGTRQRKRRKHESQVRGGGR